MFDNLETALIQALGFFSVFGFFVYQTLFANKKTKNPKINPKKTKTSDTKKYINNELSPKYTATNPSAQPVNKYFPIKKRTRHRKIKYFTSLKKI